MSSELVKSSSTEVMDKSKNLGWVPRMRHLSQDMATLLSSGEYSDLTISCKNIKFNVHRAIILPRCAFFRACFETGFKEGGKGTVSSDDDDPVALRLALLEIYARSPYIVKEHFEANEDADLNLMVQIWTLADKYQLPELASQCLTYFRSEKGLALLKQRSGLAWTDHLLMALSELKHLQDADNSTPLYKSLRDDLKRLFMFARDIAEITVAGEAVLKADFDLTMELLNYAIDGFSTQCLIAAQAVTEEPPSKKVKGSKPNPNVR